MVVRELQKKHVESSQERSLSAQRKKLNNKLKQLYATAPLVKEWGSLQRRAEKSENPR